MLPVSSSVAVPSGKDAGSARAATHVLVYLIYPQWGRKLGWGMKTGDQEVEEGYSHPMF